MALLDFALHQVPSALQQDPHSPAAQQQHQQGDAADEPEAQVPGRQHGERGQRLVVRPEPVGHCAGNLHLIGACRESVQLQLGVRCLNHLVAVGRNPEPVAAGAEPVFLLGHHVEGEVALVGQFHPVGRDRERISFGEAVEVAVGDGEGGMAVGIGVLLLVVDLYETLHAAEIELSLVEGADRPHILVGLYAVRLVVAHEAFRGGVVGVECGVRADPHPSVGVGL